VLIFCLVNVDTWVPRYVALSLGKIVAQPPDLSTCLKVTVDGHVLKLPSIQALLVINLPSYMKGTDAWGDIATDVRQVGPTPNFQNMSSNTITQYSPGNLRNTMTSYSRL